MMAVEAQLVTPRLVPARTTLAGHPALRVGDGPESLLVVPGLNDPLLRVTERRWFDATMGQFMRKFADGRTVYFVSRPRGLDDDTTVGDLTDGYERVLDEIGPATVLGMSLGGFVGIELAARDDRVEGLIMGLAAHRLNPAGKRLVREWRELAIEERWRDIYLGAADVLGTGLRRRAYRFAGRTHAVLSGKPRAAGDFIPTANACLQYDGSERLPEIGVRTLVIGGSADQFFAGMDFATMANAVPHGEFVEIEGAGHEAVIERPEFDDAIYGFLES